MNEGLKAITQRVAKKLNKNVSDVQPFFMILQQNWYDTVESLQVLKIQQYEQMKIPRRLALLIIEQVSLSLNKSVQSIQQQILSQTQPKEQPIQQARQLTSIKGVNNITEAQKSSSLKEEIKKQNAQEKKVVIQKKKKPQNELDEGLLHAMFISMIESLKGKIKRKTDFLPIFDILQKIIQNIVNDPYNMKFRSIKKSNPKVNDLIIAHDACVKFLQSIGFLDLGETLQLHIFQINHLHFVIQQIKMQVQIINRPEMGNKVDNRPQQRSFQNKQSLFIDFSKIEKQGPQQNVSEEVISKQFTAQKLSEMKYCDALEKLIQIRNTIMANPPKNRRLRIIQKQRETKEIPSQQISFEHYFETTDDKIIANYWAQIIANNKKSQQFQSKRKMEFDFLIKQKVHKETLIKIKLPNGLIIEGYFGPLQKLQTVLQVISDIVIGDLYLFTAPPRKIMKEELKKNLIELQSVPTGNFYLGSNDNCYINKDYIPFIEK